jgi:hypothetical protein
MTGTYVWPAQASDWRHVSGIDNPALRSAADKKMSTPAGVAEPANKREKTRKRRRGALLVAAAHPGTRLLPATVLLGALLLGALLLGALPPGHGAYPARIGCSGSHGRPLTLANRHAPCQTLSLLCRSAPRHSPVNRSELCHCR